MAPTPHSYENSRSILRNVRSDEGDARIRRKKLLFTIYTPSPDGTVSQDQRAFSRLLRYANGLGSQRASLSDSRESERRNRCGPARICGYRLFRDTKVQAQHWSFAEPSAAEDLQREGALPHGIRPKAYPDDPAGQIRGASIRQ